MKATQATVDILHEKDVQSMVDFIIFAQRNLILKLQPILRRTRVSLAHFYLLLYMAEEESVSMGVIAQLMGHTTAAATGVVDKLEDLGHLRRVAAARDRRKTLVKITDRGRTLVNKMRLHIEQALTEVREARDIQIIPEQAEGKRGK